MLFVIFQVNDERKKLKDNSATMSSSSRVSTKSIQQIISKLQNQAHHSSMYKTYLCVWRKFNKFPHHIRQKT